MTSASWRQLQRENAVRRWENVLPEQLATRQAAWERSRRVVRAREAGIKFIEIGEWLGVTSDRARQIYEHQLRREKRGQRAPILEYFDSMRTGGERPERYRKLRRTKRHPAVTPEMVWELERAMDRAARAMALPG